MNAVVILLDRYRTKQRPFMQALAAGKTRSEAAKAARESRKPDPPTPPRAAA